MRILLSILLIVLGVVAQGQTRPNWLPSPYAPVGYYRIAYLKADSGLITAYRDTLGWFPRFTGTIVTRPQDNKPYFYDSSQLRWYRLAFLGDPAGSVAWGTITGTLTAQTDLYDSLLQRFRQNGNSFGDTARLGTNDNYGLNFRVNGTDRFVITTTAGIIRQFSAGLRINGTGGTQGGISFTADMPNNNAVNGGAGMNISTSTTGTNGIRLSPANSGILATSTLTKGVLLTSNFTPADGTFGHTIFDIVGTINQGGSSPGQSRGIHLHPTIINSPTFIALQSDTGNVIIKGGRVGVNTETPTTRFHVGGTGLFTDTLTATTMGVSDSSHRVATTAWVKQQAYGPGSSPTLQQVTDAGSTSTNEVTVNKILANTNLSVPSSTYGSNVTSPPTARLFHTTSPAISLISNATLPTSSRGNILWENPGAAEKIGGSAWSNNAYAAIQAAPLDSGTIWQVWIATKNKLTSSLVGKEALVVYPEGNGAWGYSWTPSVGANFGFKVGNFAGSDWTVGYTGVPQLSDSSLFQINYARRFGVKKNMETKQWAQGDSLELIAITHRTYKSTPFEGTDGYIQKTNSRTAVDNSIVYQTAANLIGVNTTTPNTRFDVNGPARFDSIRVSSQPFPTQTYPRGYTPQVRISGTSTQLEMLATASGNADANIVFSNSASAVKISPATWSTNAVFAWQNTNDASGAVVSQYMATSNRSVGGIQGQNVTNYYRQGTLAGKYYHWPTFVAEFEMKVGEGFGNVLTDSSVFQVNANSKPLLLRNVPLVDLDTTTYSILVTDKSTGRTYRSAWQTGGGGSSSAGTYTPTITNGTNVTGTPTAHGFKYMVIGNTVHISGRIKAITTTIGATSTLEFTLPPGFTSDIQDVDEVTGTVDVGNAVANPDPTSGGYATGNTSTDRIVIYFTSASTGEENNIWVEATYTISNL